MRQVILIQEYLGIVMEYCPGGTLADFMAARLCTGPDGGLPEKTARCHCWHMSCMRLGLLPLQTALPCPA